MKDLLISIVLPIYNVEKYLDRCIESVVNQTYKNLEIILVDDESPDNCPEMCNQWASKDSRIKVIHKKNEGLGMARNTGIENATGDYICFFDSDDYIELNTIEELVKSVNHTSADIVSFGFNRVNSRNEITKTYKPNTNKDIYENDEIFNFILPEIIYANPKLQNQTNIWLSACMSMFSMKLIKECNWEFVSEREIISEDVYSLLNLYKNINKIAIVKEAFYNYFINEQSLTQTYREDRFIKLKEFYLRTIQLFEENEKYSLVRERISELYLSFTIAALKQIIASSESFKLKRKKLKFIINDDLLQKVLKEKNKSIDTIQRKILFFLIKNKYINLVALLLNLKK